MKKFFVLLSFVFSILASRGILTWLSDKWYIYLCYFLKMRKFPNLKNPQTYNEKLQWLKLYDRNPAYTNLADKYKVRKFVENRIGEQYLIPLLGIWDKPEDIDFKLLPDQFVLKCNHDSGGTIICKDKSKFDEKAAITFLKKRLRRNYFWMGREWPYKNIEKKIIAEKYMVDESGYELKDYKFFCFDGICRAVFIATDRGIDTRFDFYDRNFNHLPFTNGHDNATQPPKKPESFEKMIELAETLSKGIPQVRVDLYNIYGVIFFGEMTFFHWGGMMRFVPEEWDYKFGSWIKLPNKHK